MKNVLIHTKNLIIREMTIADSLAIERIRLSIAANPQNKPYYDLKTTEHSFNMCHQAVEEQKVTPRKTLSLVVAEKQNPNKMIGFIIGELTDLGDWQGEKGLCDLGYFMDAAYQGKGYATEASRAFMSKIYFEKLNYDHISASVDPENTPSIKVLESLGFKKYGEIVYKQDRNGPRMYMHVTKDEFYNHTNASGENKNLIASNNARIVRGLLPQKSLERE